MLLTQLPLENARFSNVHLTSDRGCIGLGQLYQWSLHRESTSNWLTEDNGTPYGVVEAITVTNSQSVVVEPAVPPPPCVTSYRAMTVVRADVAANEGV
ncbi:MAG: hypothetical protein R3A52_14350 [Polyangiales bacterium]